MPVSPPVRCVYTRMMSLDELDGRRHPDNPNTHPYEQIKILADTIARTGWRDLITISNLSGRITRGHGRLAAAKRLGCSEAPVEFQDYADESEEIADMLADNRIQSLSILDMGKAVNLLQTRIRPELRPSTGFLPSEISLMTSIQESEPPPPSQDKDEDFQIPGMSSAKEQPKRRETPSFICPNCGFKSA